MPPVIAAAAAVYALAAEAVATISLATITSIVVNLAISVPLNRPSVVLKMRK